MGAQCPGSRSCPSVLLVSQCHNQFVPRTEARRLHQLHGSLYVYTNIFFKYQFLDEYEIFNALNCYANVNKLWLFSTCFFTNEETDETIDIQLQLLFKANPSQT